MPENKVIDPLPELLIGAGLASAEKIKEAQTNAQNQGYPLQKSLVLMGLVNPEIVQMALTAEERVKSGRLTQEIATKALKMAQESGIPFDDAASVMGSVQRTTRNKIQAVANPLTDLLLETEIIDIQQLGKAVQKSRDENKDIGKILISEKLLSNSTMLAALNALLMVNTGKIKREKAIEALKAVVRRRVSLEQVLFESGSFVARTNQTVSMVELFAMAGFLNSNELLECLELEVTKSKPTSEAVSELGVANQDLVAAANHLLDMLGCDAILAYQAAEALKEVKSKGISIYQALAELKHKHSTQEKSSFQALLSGAEIVDDAYLKTLGDISGAPIKLGKMLLSAGLIEESFLFCALRCYSLHKQGCLSAEDAVKALSISKKQKVNLDEALGKVALLLPSRMQWVWI